MTGQEIQKQASCEDDFDPASLPADTALARILDSITAISDTEHLAIRECLGRVLAVDIISPINVPSGTNSAMDGYAISGEDIPDQGSASLQVLGTAYAGKPWKGEVRRGQCIRIMTGAVMPYGTDTVIMQEHVELMDDRVRIGTDVKPGANVRQAGEDISSGDTVLTAGTYLTPADIGFIASLGVAEIPVFRRLKVAFFSTGDELRSIGETLAEGQIYDSNRYTLYGMLHRLGVEILDMGVIGDNPQALREGFEQASADADVLITSGGVSVGEADYVKDILQEVGTVNFWKVAMKPGRPLAFGRINRTWFFGLPGNPVSVMVTFYQFVQPALYHLAGCKQFVPNTFQVTCTSRLRKKPGRIEYQRGILQRDENGALTVARTGMQGSGILRSMTQANCFIILPMESGNIEPGMTVAVQPFFGIV